MNRWFRVIRNLSLSIVLYRDAHPSNSLEYMQYTYLSELQLFSSDIYMESSEEALLRKFEALLEAKISPLVDSVRANAESIERISTLVAGFSKDSAGKPTLSRPRTAKAEDTKSEDGKKAGERTPKPHTKTDSEDKHPKPSPKPKRVDAPSTPDPKPTTAKRHPREEVKKEEEPKPAPHHDSSKPKRPKPEDHKAEEAKNPPKDTKPSKPAKPAKPAKPGKKKTDDRPARPTILELLSKKDLKPIADELSHLEKVLFTQAHKKALNASRPFSLSPASEHALILLDCLTEADLFLLDSPGPEVIWVFRLMYWLRNLQLSEDDDEAWTEVRKVLVPGQELPLGEH